MYNNVIVGDKLILLVIRLYMYMYLSCFSHDVALFFLCVFQFFNNALVVGKSSESEVAEHLYDLILELHAIDSSVLLSVLPQLEFKLKVNGREVLY